MASEKVLTMSGPGEGSSASCPPCEKRQRTATLVVTKVRRYPNGRRCERLNEAGKSCRCAHWLHGRGGKSVAKMCEEAGREFRIGSRVLKART